VSARSTGLQAEEGVIIPRKGLDRRLLDEGLEAERQLGSGELGLFKKPNLTMGCA
jgi:hypothetical protein